MLSQKEINNMEEDIRQIYMDKDYETCITKCKVLITKLRNKEVTGSYNLWFVYNMIGRTYIYYNIENHNNLAIYYIKKALQYSLKSFTNAPIISEIAYIQTIWLLAREYESINKNKDAINCYEICENYYDELINKGIDEDEIFFQLAEVLNNKGKILQDKNIINKALYIYKSKSCEDFKKIDEAYNNLLEIMIKENCNLIEIQQIINKIKNIQIKQKWTQEVFNKSAKTRTLI